MKFPKMLYTNWAGSENEKYLETVTSIENIDESAKDVAIYELKEIKTLKVTRELK